MKINISDQKPPIWTELQKHFIIDWDKTVVTYGDTIYSQYKLMPDVFVHEKVHILQQQITGRDEWWKKYIDNPQFRISQEAQAYKAQYNSVKKIIKKPELHLIKLAKDLSGGMYGEAISFEKALKMIK